MTAGITQYADNPGSEQASCIFKDSTLSPRWPRVPSFLLPRCLVGSGPSVPVNVQQQPWHGGEFRVQHLASRHVLLHSAARLRCAFPADDPRCQASFCRFSCYSTMAESSCSWVALFHGEALPAPHSPQLSRLMGRWVSDASGLWPGRGSLSEEVTLVYERYLPPLAALAAAGGG